MIECGAQCARRKWLPAVKPAPAAVVPSSRQPALSLRLLRSYPAAGHSRRAMAAAKTDRAEPPTTACGAAGRECCLLTRLGVPSSIANFAMGTQLAIALIVAPLGEDAIAGAGIGVMWQNVTAVSVFVGIQYGFGAL